MINVATAGCWEEQGVGGLKVLVKRRCLWREGVGEEKVLVKRRC